MDLELTRSATLIVISSHGCVDDEQGSLEVGHVHHRAFGTAEVSVRIKRFDPKHSSKSPGHFFAAEAGKQTQDRRRPSMTIAGLNRVPKEWLTKRSELSQI